MLNSDQSMRMNSCPCGERVFEKAVGIVDEHPLRDQKEYLLTQVVPNYEVRLAMVDQKIVGFVAASFEWVDQLYIHNNYQGLGIGTRLLNWAKERSSGRLRLYTFKRNTGAQRFYEGHGFRIVDRGFEEKWQLEDIKYEWVRPSSSLRHSKQFLSGSER